MTTKRNSIGIPKFALRLQGTSDFVRTLPHDFEDANFVSGWSNIDGPLLFASEAEALAAIASDPDGESLDVEEIPCSAQLREEKLAARIKSLESELHSARIVTNALMTILKENQI
jgi:hypothetical protein